jgi:methylenetetrahydrofolate reductase (NADPH)
MPRAQVSFEIFPPQDPQASARLWEAVSALSPLSPDFISVTYGAGGGTRSQTQDTLTTLQRNHGVQVAAHLTCVGASRAQTLDTAAAYAAAGVRQIVALRGDAPQGTGRFTPHPDGFANTVELIAALAKTGQFTLRVGAYPERHPDAANAQADVDWLKRKIDAGASSAITQFFFEADTFLRFRDACTKAGITAPIIPGILPIHRFNNLQFDEATHQVGERHARNHIIINHQRSHEMVPFAISFSMLRKPGISLSMVCQSSRSAAC